MPAAKLATPLTPLCLGAQSCQPPETGMNGRRKREGNGFLENRFKQRNEQWTCPDFVDS